MRIPVVQSGGGQGFFELRILERQCLLTFAHVLAPNPVIDLTINGQPRSFPAPINVSALVEQLELAGKRIALERNGEIVPRSKFDAVELEDGDALEIVVAVGGG